MRLVSARWRWPKLLWALIIVEFCSTVAVLALFGIAAPNLYRTKLWTEGDRLGLSSDPLDVLYAAANYRPAPAPLVWSQFITNFNLVISVLSMFIMIVKSIMMLMHIFVPLVSFAVHGLLVGLYAYSVYGQAGDDNLNGKHFPGPPWYITHSCSIAQSSLQGYCKQALASFIMTCLMLALFSIYVIYAIFSNFFPGPKPIHDADEELKSSPQSDITTEQQWELQQAEPPLTGRSTTAMKSPTTPRTMAFHSLGGESSRTAEKSPTQRGSRDLPLRDV